MEQENIGQEVNISKDRIQSCFSELLEGFVGGGENSPSSTTQCTIESGKLNRFAERGKVLQTTCNFGYVVGVCEIRNSHLAWIHASCKH